jgi:metal-responsive CopG/Arc/MetJ family transcriptional regulator
MSQAKIAITVNRELLREVDALVEERIYPSRSRAIQEAIAEKLRRLKGSRLAAECAQLDPEHERVLAEEGMEIEEWPEY